MASSHQYAKGIEYVVFNDPAVKAARTMNELAAAVGETCDRLGITDRSSRISAAEIARLMSKPVPHGAEAILGHIRSYIQTIQPAPKKPEV